jgi:hypothetical protein
MQIIFKHRKIAFLLLLAMQVFSTASPNTIKVHLVMWEIYLIYNNCIVGDNNCNGSKTKKSHPASSQ